MAVAGGHAVHRSLEWLKTEETRDSCGNPERLTLCVVTKIVTLHCVRLSSVIDEIGREAET